jgi:uncharacterized protein YjiS (DUF1127 family)
MSCTEKSCSTLGTSTLSASVRLWRHWPRALWRRFRRARELQRQRRALLELDQHQLKDIGLTREQALREASKLFWTRV